MRLQKERVDEMKQLSQLLSLLVSEIEYHASTLPEAMIHISASVRGSCGRWFEETGRKMLSGEGIPFSELWISQVDKLSEQTVLETEIIEELKRMGTQLAKPDIQSQIQAIRMYQKRCAEAEQRLSGELPGKLKISASLMVLAGAFLVILFI